MKNLLSFFFVLCVSVECIYSQGKVLAYRSPEEKGTEVVPGVSANSESKNARFVFYVYGQIPELKSDFPETHYLGQEIAGKWTTFIGNYTKEYTQSVGLSGTSVEILKPSVYRAVIKLNKFYKKALKSNSCSVDEARKEMSHILDCANVICFEDKTRDFEEAVKNAKDARDLISIFDGVVLLSK